MSRPKVQLGFWQTMQITALVLLTLPFWVFPLFFGAIIKIIELENAGMKIESAYTFLQFFYALIPFTFAYGTFLAQLVRAQIQKANNKLKITTLKTIFKKHATSILILFCLQFVDLVINRFDPDTFLIQISLSIFYFSTALFMFSYTKIIDSAPVA